MTRTTGRRMICDLCQRTVRDEFTPKWKHIVRYHPEVLATRLAPLIADPGAAERLGVGAAVSVIRRVLHVD